MDDRRPYIYKTTDFGTSWTKVTGNIPSGHPLDYILSLAENPNRKGMLFAGTGRAFYYSLDDGTTWTQFKDGLPPAPVSWITDGAAVPRRRRLDLRARPLHSAQHHAARAVGAGRTGGDDDEGLRTGGRSSARRGKPFSRPAVRTSRSRSRRQPAAPIQMEILDASRR